MNLALVYHIQRAVGANWQCDGRSNPACGSFQTGPANLLTAKSTIRRACISMRTTLNPTAPSTTIEAFERPPQGRFVRNAGSMIMLFAIMARLIAPERKHNKCRMDCVPREFDLTLRRAFLLCSYNRAPRCGRGQIWACSCFNQEKDRKTCADSRSDLGYEYMNFYIRPTTHCRTIGDQVWYRSAHCAPACRGIWGGEGVPESVTGQSAKQIAPRSSCPKPRRPV